MPSKRNPRDWNRLFRKGAPRRGGPIRVMFTWLLLFLILGGVGFGAVYGLEASSELIEEREIAQLTAISIQNATTQAQNQTVVAQRTAQSQPPTPTPTIEAVANEPIGAGSISEIGPIRNAPDASEAAIIGQVCPGDRLVLLQETEGDGGPWFQVRVVETGENCSPQRVSIGSSGWLSVNQFTRDP